MTTEKNQLITVIEKLTHTRKGCINENVLFVKSIMCDRFSINLFFLLFYQHFSPSPSLIFQCSPIFWSRSNQINYLWDTTCKNCLNFFFGLWIQWECKFFCMSLGFVTCWILFIFFSTQVGEGSGLWGGGGGKKTT